MVKLWYLYRLNLKCPTWKGLAMLGELNSTTTLFICCCCCCSGVLCCCSGVLCASGSLNSGLSPHRYLVKRQTDDNILTEKHLKQNLAHCIKSFLTPKTTLKTNAACLTCQTFTIRYAYLNDLLFILPFSFFLSSPPFLSLSTLPLSFSVSFFSPLFFGL